MLNSGGSPRHLHHDGERLASSDVFRGASVADDVAHLCHEAHEPFLASLSRHADRSRSSLTSQGIQECKRVLKSGFGIFGEKKEA